MAPLKGIIFYYSGTGNTALACRHISDHMASAEIQLFDILGGGVPDLSAYGIVGFAAFADFRVVSEVFAKFVDSLPRQEGKPTFVFNTYGMSSGKTLQVMDRLVADRGFKVVAGHALHMPESFPPLIAKGMGNDNAPNDKELAAFKRFVAELDNIALRLSRGEDVPAGVINLGTANKVLPTYPKGLPERMMGEKFVDEALCTGCGTCANICPNGAITVDSKPHFDPDKCSYCWACYNHCLFEAIYTKKYRKTAHYQGPSAALQDKLR